MYYRRSPADILSEQVSQQGVEIAIFVLVILVYLLVRAIALLARVLVHYPEEKVLWIVLGLSMGCLLLGGVCFVANPHGWAGAVLCGAGVYGLALLLLIARVIELRHDDMFLEEPRPGLMLDRVLHRSWWPAS